ncbi:MAG: hypothetical protein JG777_162 [Clostridia bacterium]|jgi:Co/Zn/Cd efflux system component|uniref:hypothetical protein n=1 Tax=Petroclostridium xylanilyticum TaxID=1792311 RepID=UPI000B983337|nr:hypothetical protein [Petroclostridium xylanilyticum]MBZ4644673.1 hypothetical protein [Clostridia bacterium]
MIIDILAFLLLAAGALIGYKADFLYKIIKGSNPDEKQLIVLKIAGLLIVVIGMILIFYRK